VSVQRLAVLEFNEHGVALCGCEEAERKLEIQSASSDRTGTYADAGRYGENV
jgi:hypothetical protein